MTPLILLDCLGSHEPGWLRVVRQLCVHFPPHDDEVASHIHDDFSAHPLSRCPVQSVYYLHEMTEPLYGVRGGSVPQPASGPEVDVLMLSICYRLGELWFHVVQTARFADVRPQSCCLATAPQGLGMVFYIPRYLSRYAVCCYFITGGINSINYAAYLYLRFQSWFCALGDGMKSGSAHGVPM